MQRVAQARLSHTHRLVLFEHTRFIGLKEAIKNTGAVAVTGGFVSLSPGRAGKRPRGGKAKCMHQRINNLSTSNLHHLHPTYQQPAPQGTSTGLTDKQIAQFKQLGALHESGILTDAEFGAAKQKILGI